MKTTDSTYYMISFTKISRKCQLIDGKADQWFSGNGGGLGRGESGGSQRTLGNFQGEGCVHHLDVMVSQCIHV